MRNVLKIITAGLMAISCSSFAMQYNPSLQGMGLGEQFGGNNSFGVSCLCARSVTNGTNQDPICEQNVKRMVEAATGGQQNNPFMNGLQPGVTPGLQHNPASQVPNSI